MTKKLVIFGTRIYGEIVWDYFTHDSDYEVVAFTVDKQYLNEETFCGLPVVPFEDIETHYPPDEYHMHIAIVYGDMNRLREKKYLEAKQKNYTLANYISSHAFVWHNVKMGDNCFIFEHNTVQPSVTMGNGVILWSGNHIAHHTIIGDYSFITSHVVLAGFCEVGTHCFLGGNVCMRDQITIGNYCWVGHGAVLNNDIPDFSMVRAEGSQVKPLKEKVLNRYLSSRSMG